MLQEQYTADMRGPVLKGPIELRGASMLISAGNSPARLVYADFSDGLHIWIAKDGEVRSRWVEIAKQDFENMTREFAEKCAVEDSSLDDLHRLGARLFSVLLQPVISDLAPRTDCRHRIGPLELQPADGSTKSARRLVL